MIKGKKELGRWGEKKAEHYLTKKGHTIIAQNYRQKIGEIDIISLYHDIIVFTEVKTRQTKRFGPPSTAVNGSKQNKIKKLANYFLQENELFNYNIRFDVITISITEEKRVIKHFINAF